MLRALCGLQQDTEQEPAEEKPRKAATERESAANAARANMRSDDAAFRAQDEARCEPAPDALLSAAARVMPIAPCSAVHVQPLTLVHRR